MNKRPTQTMPLLMGLLLLAALSCSTAPEPAAQDGSCAANQLSCAAGCIDPLSDSNNCGGCGMACNGGQTCSVGSCSCPPRTELCNGGCVAAGTCGGTAAGGSGGGAATTAASGTTGFGDGGSAATGGGGTGSTIACNFSNLSVTSSEDIATVGIVTFATDLAGMTGAEIHFTPSGGAGTTLIAPVSLAEANYRTLLLGMKGDTQYDVQVVASAGASTCMSEVQQFRTGYVPSAVPAITQQGDVTPGFIVTSNGIGNFGGMLQVVGDTEYAFIFDQDGDVVWYAPAPSQTSRARMSYDGKWMYMMSLNVQGGMGRMDRISMDGGTLETNLMGVDAGHHDFTIMPDNSIVAIVHTNGCSGIVQRSDSGQMATIVESITSIYQPMGDCHPNAIHYYPGDDTFTISDRNPNLFVKITRQGQVLWQLGGDNPKGNHFPGSWQVNHGHILLDNGNFLFFNNAIGGQSPVYELSLDESNWTTSEVWSYTSNNNSATLGDVQRLPNGNTLVTYSNNGTIHEVNPAAQEVGSFTSSAETFGYSNHRESLYGPPPLSL